MDNLIIVAKISAPFGIKGLAKVISFMQNPEDIFSHQLYDQNNTPYKLTKYSTTNKNSFVAQINDITNRTIIESLGKINFYIDKKSLTQLNDDEFYALDLIGLKVKNTKHEDIGIVKNIYNFGAGDILEIEFNDGSMYMYPFLKVYFPQIEDKYVIFQDA